MSIDYQYTGQRWQAKLGLYYYRARWYDPQMRRFVQADSIVPEPGNPQTLNRYAYVYNNPLRYVDPSGHIGMGNLHAAEDGNWPPSSPAIMSFLMPSIINQSERFGVPWQVTAGLLESEIVLDTDIKDHLESAFFLCVLPLAWGGIAPAQIAAISAFYLRPNPGPGVGNIHLDTAQEVSRYMAENYAENEGMQLGLHNKPDDMLAYTLSMPAVSVAVASAYIRMLADYRFGSGGQPQQMSHSDMGAWSTIDATAIWHGYRFGLNDVSPGGQGFALDNFQSRSSSLATTVDLATGVGKVGSIYGAQPYIQRYWDH